MEIVATDEFDNALAHQLPGWYSGLHPRMHPPHPMHPDASVHSDAHSGSYLVRSEWFAMPVCLDLREGELEDNGDLRMFHGTEWGSAYQIVRGRAFIIGQGTHSIRGRSKSGCWCVPTLLGALLRSNPPTLL